MSADHENMSQHDDDGFRRDEIRVRQALRELALEGKRYERCEAMAARTALAVERVAMIYRCLYYAGMDVPHPGDGSEDARAAIIGAARALHPLAGLRTTDEFDRATPAEQPAAGVVHNGEVWAARDALTRLELLLNRGRLAPWPRPTAITAECEVPPPLGYLMRAQVPMETLLDAIGLATLALHGSRQDQQETLRMLRGQLEAWAADMLAVEEVEHTAAARRIGQAVIALLGYPTEFALKMAIEVFEDLARASQDSASASVSPRTSG